MGDVCTGRFDEAETSIWESHIIFIRIVLIRVWGFAPVGPIKNVLELMLVSTKWIKCQMAIHLDIILCMFICVLFHVENYYMKLCMLL